ncbi:hypothetical protein EDD18DRAFT_1108866 [Armillaria luteobubalina]|uniref:Uncharacterized protein n=1 Tax=Armillaria luteobubalina TaxID=153913 RepID=A0AA39TK33_9AGAR|nr:hypothetical protein EDD18DRAFT_1108866 [Armillaria luteobubalina]
MSHSAFTKSREDEGIEQRAEEWKTAHPHSPIVYDAMSRECTKLIIILSYYKHWDVTKSEICTSAHSSRHVPVTTEEKLVCVRMRLSKPAGCSVGTDRLGRKDAACIGKSRYRSGMMPFLEMGYVITMSRLPFHHAAQCHDKRGTWVQSVPAFSSPGHFSGPKTCTERRFQGEHNRCLTSKYPATAHPRYSGIPEDEAHMPEWKGDSDSGGGAD